jgi:iron complex outermembrane recepter protein
MKPFGLLIFSVLSITVASSLSLSQTSQPPGSAAAPTADTSGELVEIVVTAQRRAERLQDVPISVVALSAKSLAASGVTSTDALGGAVPGLTFTKVGASGVPFIRGVGSAAGDPSSEPSVTTYIDGVYMASPNVDVFDFNAVDQIEVLKGPQGTLFGRNATGGVIQVHTLDPSFTPSAQATVGYANYRTTTASAYATTSLSDTVAVNIAGEYRNQDGGYGHDLTTGAKTYIRDSSSVRVKFLFQPTDLTRVLVEGDYNSVTSTANDYTLPNGSVGRNGVVTELPRYDTTNDINDITNTASRGGSITIDHDFGQFTIKSISAYRKATGINFADVDATAGPFFVADLHLDQSNLSQEIHLGSAEDSQIKWLTGLYYYNSIAGYEPAGLYGADLGGISEAITGLVRTKSASAFGQVTDEVFRDTNLTVGVRYTDEEQQFQTRTNSSVGLLSPEAGASQDFRKPTWRLALDHKFEPDIMGYISYNRGIKSGGFSPLSSAQTAAFKPEQLDAYEIGLKTEFFEHRLRLNSSAYLYEYKDIQVQVVDGAATFTQNAASALIKGLELAFDGLLTQDLTLSGGIAYADGYYKDYPSAASYGPGVGPLITIDATGNTTVRTPKLSGSISLGDKFHLGSGTLEPSITETYTSKFYWSADNTAAQSGYGLLNASARWLSQGERFSAALWIKNITDKQYLSLLSESSYGSLTQQADPRTYGITLGVKY